MANFGNKITSSHLVQTLVKYTQFAPFVSVRNSKVSIYNEENVNIILIIPNPQNGNMISLYDLTP